MANELIGMFGQSPEMTQLGLQQGRDANMAQLAQMSKGSMLAYGAGTAADRLGGAIGGMLGGTDPRMEEANKNKQVQQAAIEEARMQGIDPGRDQEKFMQIVTQKFSDAGMTDKAMQVQNILQSMKAQQAEIAYKEAKARAEDKKATTEASPFAKIDPSKYTQESMRAFMQSQNPADLKAVPDAAKNKVVTTAGGVYMVDDQGRPINRIGDPFASTNISMGGTKDFAKVQNLREGFLKEVKPFEENIAKIDDVIRAARGATSNPTDAASLPNLLANYFGDSQTAKAEIERFSKMGSLYDRTLEGLSRGLVGESTEQGVRTILDAMYKYKTANENKRRMVISQYNKVGDVSPEDRSFITSSAYKDKENPLPSRLILGNKEYTSITPDNIVSTITKSSLSTEEKKQWLKLVIDNKWDE